MISRKMSGFAMLIVAPTSTPLIRIEPLCTGSLGFWWMTGTGCVGAMLWRGLQSSSPETLSKYSSIICFLRESR